VLSQVGIELSAIQTAFEESDKIKKIIKNPTNIEDQKKLVTAFCENQGTHKITKNFLLLLIENSRFKNIAQISES